jgi:hypothetical protein
MARSKKKWVALSQEQLQLESAASSAKMVGENEIHSVEPIPDHDWVGGTWGLFWSDYEDELRELLEKDTESYIKEHQEDKVMPETEEVNILSCPEKENSPDIMEPLEIVEDLPDMEIVDLIAPLDIAEGPLLPEIVEDPQLQFADYPPSIQINENPLPVNNLFQIQQPLQPETLQNIVQEPLGMIAVLEYETKDPYNYIILYSTIELNKKATVNTAKSLRCPESLKLNIKPPIELIYEAGSTIGTLGVVLLFEYKIENATKFWKTHKEDSMKGARACSVIENSLLCPEE